MNKLLITFLIVLALTVPALTSGIIEDGSNNDFGSGTPVYPEDSCTGPVINGVCKGDVLHPGPAEEKCYGDWLNGECTGPQF